MAKVKKSKKELLEQAKKLQDTLRQHYEEAVAKEVAAKEDVEELAEELDVEPGETIEETIRNIAVQVTDRALEEATRRPSGRSTSFMGIVSTPEGYETPSLDTIVYLDGTKKTTFR